MQRDRYVRRRPTDSRTRPADLTPHPGTPSAPVVHGAPSSPRSREPSTRPHCPTMPHARYHVHFRTSTTKQAASAMNIDQSVQINADPEAVFAFITDT